jgi:hypothetical protein
MWGYIHNRLRVFEKRVLRKIISHKQKWQEAGENYTIRSFITSTLHQTLLLR